MKQKIILDGGMGRELERMGAPFAQPEWSALALMERPDLVKIAHENFIKSGAAVITPNSYAILPFHIGQDRYDARGFALIEQAAKLAREAADESDQAVKVAGCLPPLFGSYRPDLFDPALAPEMLHTFITAQAPYVDLWLAETLCSVTEARAVCDALTSHGSDKPLWLSFCPTKEDWKTLHLGERLDDAIAFTRDETDAQAILYNCCNMENIEHAVARTAELLGDDRRQMIGVYPNLFRKPSVGANVGITPLLTDEVSPAEYAEAAQGWADAGADIIGGCCGVSPEHIAALKNF